ncbi:BPG-independent [Armillaria nabsnona]|nr:BPG-independent [Armillaria nabsnona]
MDRDKRWDRVKIAIDGLVGGVGETATETGVATIKVNYEKDLTDEFLKPIIVNGDAGRIKDGDSLFFFNYRSDRMREFSSVFGLPDKPMEVAIPKDLSITTMSRYNIRFPCHVAFPSQAMTI